MRFYRIQQIFRNGCVDLKIMTLLQKYQKSSQLCSSRPILEIDSIFFFVLKVAKFCRGYHTLQYNNKAKNT